MNPTYRNIGDHTETVDIEFDPHKTSFATLLDNFWKWHDPTSSHSRQYMSAIFYHDEEQKQLAEKSKEEHQKHIAKPIATVITKAGPFYDAENYHQKYILRCHSKVLDKLNLTDEELIKSKAACRLNGYLGGFGTEEDLLKDSGDLGIPESVIGYVKGQMKKSSRY